MPLLSILNEKKMRHLLEKLEKSVKHGRFELYLQINVRFSNQV